MSLKLVSLASGSRGNATLIISDTTAILVDAGISYTKIANGLKEFGLTPSMLDGVVITHEHSDHIAGVPRLSNDTKIYAVEQTARAIFERQGVLKNYQEVEYYEGGFEIGDIKVMPFRIPHDAAYPLGYSFACGSARCSVATDIGVPTRGVLKNISDSEVVLLEANHDLEMLKNGPYNRCLKERIMSNTGHLSNDSTARIAELLVGSHVHSLVLGHMSAENNLPSLALSTVGNKLLECENAEIELYLAFQDRRSEVFEIK
ncbi:MAG: MBL fold metallo-hydrolase [Clostridia bacterium]